MFEPYSIPFWTAMAAVVGFGQVVVLIVTACFVWRYLRATEDLGRSTRDQVSESRKLVKAAQLQAEAQIRPAVATFVQGSTLWLKNVGSGAALNLRLVQVPLGAPIDWVARASVGQGGVSGSFLATGVLFDTTLPTTWFGAKGKEQLHAFYDSLSGQQYASVIRFDGQYLPTDTRFAVRE